MDNTSSVLVLWQLIRFLISSRRLKVLLCTVFMIAVVVLVVVVVQLLLGIFAAVTVFLFGCHVFLLVMGSTARHKSDDTSGSTGLFQLFTDKDERAAATQPFEDSMRLNTNSLVGSDMERFLLRMFTTRSACWRAVTASVR